MTILLVLVYWGLAWVPLPYVSPEVFRSIGFPHLGGFGELSASGLGFTPYIWGFIAIELLALVSPSLRARRHGPAEERATLERAAWVLALVLATIQATGFALRIAGESTAVSWRVTRVLDVGRLGMAAVILSLVAGTALIGFLARSIGRFGLGNGFAVLLAADVLGIAARSLLRMARGAGPGRPLLIAVAAMSLLVAALRRRPAEGPRIPIPTCGLVALPIASWIFFPPAKITSWVYSTWPSLRDWIHYHVEGHLDGGVFVLSLLLALGLNRVFWPRRAVRAAWSAGAGVEPSAVDSATSDARRLSVLLVAALAAVPFACRFFKSHYLLDARSAFGLALLVAAVLDLASELRARRRLGPLVPAYPLHRGYAVDPALAALSAAGIQAFARTRHFRALLHFFAPFAPVEVLVPAARADEAAVICARIASPEGAAPPTPVPQRNPT